MDQTKAIRMMMVCRPERLVTGLLIGLVSGACVAPPPPHVAAAAPASWTVTAWGSEYEIFPDVGNLRVGEVATAHTHVTRLDDFSPLTEGSVEIVLSGPSGEQVFAAEQAIRPGIFAIEIRPEHAGEVELSFRISANGSTEEIRGGKLRVGGPQQAGALLVAPAPRAGSDGGEAVDFLKEEQWRSDFSTSWVRSGSMARSVSGLARVRPAAGGEAKLSSPVDGVVGLASGPGSWPYTGRAVDRGEPLMRVVPMVAAGRSLAALEADLSALDAELGAATIRAQRLVELLDLEATSRREVEDAELLVDTLRSRREAAERDLGSARSSRGEGSAEGFLLRAPFGGEIAAVAASPGATVAAGETLARLLSKDRFWLEVGISPVAARLLSVEGVAGIVLNDGEGPAIRIQDDLRLVSIAPELSASTGTVAVYLETSSTDDLILGTTLDAQVLLAGRNEGIVVPASALVDDGGIAVVYLQLSAERFARQVVQVVERQGEQVLVEGLLPGQRLVARGGDSIRRSSLMASGNAHGHVH